MGAQVFEIGRYEMMDDDCEDQGLCPTEHCVAAGCVIGFDRDQKPIRSKLVLRGQFWCCEKCGASYGVDPTGSCNYDNIP
jgi:hypothetical protein